ncbi:2'-5' RNA ligase family protein [Rivibacter subsaxonicus]|uniref:2'-5' RNA ligase n=1 Tax=Rivibacter subsaxonicus TaxID=457575 RepID=A0A4Q7VPY9_9BURK|nr:2'-5' RNA ligase family protein [Rivibacter subsaxonicus]RZT98218.1 2'-5' RNA ligase [Rivibacter subsaxonicus]
MARGSASDQQFALDGFEAAPPARDSLFFAVLPESAAAARIAALAQSLRDEHGLRGRPLRTDRLHATLHPFGVYPGLPPELVALARQAAASIELPPFEIEFDRVLSFRRARNRPLVLCGGERLAPLQALQQALVTAVCARGRRPPTEALYTPHVTLLYDDHGVEELAVEPITWTVREFVLMHSLVGQSLHVALGRWPLRG